VNVRLTPQEQELVQRLVSDGRYATADAAIHAALRLLEQEEAWKEDARRKIQEGLDDLKAGRVVDGDKAMEEILAELGRKHRKGG
jgi:antitoxin ParD1/3/4